MQKRPIITDEKARETYDLIKGIGTTLDMFAASGNYTRRHEYQDRMKLNDLEFDEHLKKQAAIFMYHFGYNQLMVESFADKKNLKLVKKIGIEEYFKLMKADIVAKHTEIQQQEIEAAKQKIKFTMKAGPNDQIQ